MSHAKIDSDLDLIAFAKTGAPPRLGTHVPYVSDRGYGPSSPVGSRLAGFDPRCCHKTVITRCKGCPYDVPKAERPESLTDFAAEVHRDNARWWHDPATGAKLSRNMDEMLMLVASEIAECMEGERKDLMDDHLPHRKMAEVELADAVIRLADIAGARSYFDGIDQDDIADDDVDSRPSNKGESLFSILRVLTTRPYRWAVINTFGMIVDYAKDHGYDLWGAVAEKREYNKHRADHKPEARLAPNGKRF